MHIKMQQTKNDLSYILRGCKINEFALFTQLLVGLSVSQVSIIHLCILSFPLEQCHKCNLWNMKMVPNALCMRPENKRARQNQQIIGQEGSTASDC